MLRLAELSRERFARLTAKQATLVVVAPALAGLRHVVAESFRAWARGAGEERRVVSDPLPAVLGVAPCFVVESKENYAISLTWSVPFREEQEGLDVASYRASKPLVVLAHLVAHQGPGSLSDWLQSQGYVPENLGPKVTAQAPFSTESFAIWELKIKLSEKGLRHWSRIVAAVLGLLAALSRRRYVRDALGGPRRDVLRQAVDEISTLADIAWRFPPRPPLASELANDMRQAPRPAAYAFASRRLFSATRPDLEEAKAARFTTAAAQEEAAEALAQALGALLPDRCRVTLFGSVPGNARRRQDANLDLEYWELPIDQELQSEWLTAAEELAPWWSAPPLNIYLSRADKVTKPAASPDPKIPESIKSKTLGEDMGAQNAMFPLFLQALLQTPIPIREYRESILCIQ